MRVIAGKAKGFAIKAPKGYTTRPTSDRVKEAMFSAIQFELEDSRVLDIYAGSGALGIEALSRGALFTVFIDNDDKSVEAVKKNLFKTGLSHKALVIKKDAISAINSINDKFDIIFADPPYAAGVYESMLNAVYKNDILRDNGTIILECSAKYKPVAAEGFELIKEKIYGGIKLLYLKKAGT